MMAVSSNFSYEKTHVGDHMDYSWTHPTSIKFGLS